MTERPGILWFVLDEASAEKLRLAVPPLYKNGYYHHVTLQYGVARSAVEPLIGKSWAVKAYMVASNRETQACRVDTGDLPDTYGAPHITLSTTAGTKPFASVAMLQGEHQEDNIDPIELTGTIEFAYIQDVED